VPPGPMMSPLTRRFPPAMVRAAARRHFELFRMDAARWVVPESTAPIEQVTLRRVVIMLVRFLSLRAMLWFRVGGFANEIGLPGVPSFVQRQVQRRYGLELPPGVPTGGGLYIAHPVGCVLFSESIGENVTVIGQVTFGTANDALWPVIGDRAFFGIGCRILGGVAIGHDVRVGANAVVLQDVPSGRTAVGVPARILPERGDS
jgi:serine O-acetyltransferase